MINFQIYQHGQLIEYDERNGLFKKEELQTLFIFHGLYGRGKNWQSFSKKYSQNENQIVITVDLRNHGGNEFKKNHSYFLMMEDVVKLFNYLGIKNTNLLGHSMGGKLAMLITLLYPNYADQVVIADIAPINYPNDDQNIIDALLCLDLNLIKNRNQADEFLSKYIGQKFLRSFLLQNLELFEGKYRWSINLTTIKRAMDDLRSFPSNEKINQVDKKVLCIYGEESSYVKEEHFRIFTKYFSNPLFYKMKSVGHFLHIENPDEFFEVSKSFFDN